MTASQPESISFEIFKIPMASESHKDNAISSVGDVQGKVPRPISDISNSATPIVPTPSGKTFGRSKRKRLIDLPVKPVSSYSEGLVPVFDGSPWKSYKQDLSLELGGSVAVVHKIPATEELFTIRSISGPSAEEKLFMLRQLRHENLLISFELFSFKDEFFIVSELAAISLEELTVARPDEVQVAAIIYQVRDSSLSQFETEPGKPRH